MGIALIVFLGVLLVLLVLVIAVLPAVLAGEDSHRRRADDPVLPERDKEIREAEEDTPLPDLPAPPSQ